MSVFKKMSSASADSAITDFLTDNNVSEPVLNLALKRELPSLQAIEGDLTQSGMRELVSDQLDPYLNAPTNTQGALAGSGIGALVGGVGIPLMLRQHAVKVPSLNSFAKRTAVGTGLGALAGAGIGFAADRLFRDRELRDAYEAGAMKTSEVSGRDVALGGTGLALGAGSAYLGGAGGTALQQALSNRAAENKVVTELGDVLKFEPKRAEFLTNKLKKLDGLNFTGSEGDVAQSKRAVLLKNLDDVLRARTGQRYQAAADLMPVVSRWASIAGILAGGGLLAAGIAGAANRSSKTSSDNSTGLMVGGGLGALGAGVGSYYGAKKSVRGINDRANALLIELNEPVVEAQSKLDDILSTAKYFGALESDLRRDLKRVQAKNEFRIGIPDFLREQELTMKINDAARKVKKFDNSAKFMRESIPTLLSRLDVAQVMQQAKIDARKAARDWKIGGGLGVAAGLGVLGLGLHRRLSND